jgi:hypothetical protein
MNSWYVFLVIPDNLSFHLLVIAAADHIKGA